MEHFKEMYSKLFQNCLKYFGKMLDYCYIENLYVTIVICWKWCWLAALTLMVLQTTSIYKAGVMAYFKDKNCIFHTYK